MKKECLVVNKFYQAIGVFSYRDALTAAYGDYAGRFKVIAWFDNITVKTVKGDLPFPSIVQANTTTQPILTTSKVNKELLLERDNYSCQYCGKDLNRKTMTIDHVIPRSKNGKNTWKNLVCCCKKCNQKKGDFYMDEVGMKLIQEAKTPSMPTAKRAFDDSWIPYLPFKI